LRPAPDLVVVHNDFAAPRTIRRVLSHAKVITWLHNELPAHRCGELHAPSAVVAVSDYIRNRAIAGGVPAHRVHTIRNGVNLEVFRPGDRTVDGVPRVLCVGRLDPNKGFHLALAALARARAAGCRFDVTLAGARWWYGTGEPSDYERALLDALERLGGRYVGLVPRDRIADLYREHDLAFVLSRTEDPCPLTVLEAMASGCAVIAAPRGGIPELAGDAAVLVDPDDADAVAAATERLLADPGELATWRRRAVARAAAESWSTRAEQLMELAASLGVR
jgi:glycosyltransferase involved in cell wall biosynthesis